MFSLSRFHDNFFLELVIEGHHGPSFLANFMSDKQVAGLHFPYGVWVASCTFVRTKVTCQLCQVGDYSSQLRI